MKTNLKVSNGVVHNVPTDLKKVLGSDKTALEIWEDITPLARNEWICWVEDAKKTETRNERINRAWNDLKQGKRRPCCWQGCIHRTDKPLSPSIKALFVDKKKRK